MSTAVHSIVAINRMDDLSNFADDSFYLNFFCSEITVSQLSMFYNLFQDKMSKESLMVDKSLFQECVVPILTEDQRRGFGGKRFQTLFEKIDANKDGLVSWDDISLFILQGAGTHRTASVAGGSSSFFDLVDNKKSNFERASRKPYHKDVISSMHVIDHLDVLVTAGHDGCIGVWKLKDLEMLQMIQVCPSSSTWITAITDIAWTADSSQNATTLCLSTSSMRLYYAKVDEITSAFSTADPDTACPCAYMFHGNENATCIKGFRLLHAESGDATTSSGSGPKRFDDMLAIGSENGDILIMLSQVDRMRPSEKFKVRAHSAMISALIWIAEMGILVAASHDSKISIHTFNLSRDGMSESRMFGAHSKAVNAIVYSNRDAIIASCGLERDILLWSPHTTQLLARLSAHTSSVFSLVVEPRSSSLISLGSDRQVCVWSLLKYHCIFKQHLDCQLRADVDIKSMAVAGSTLYLGTNSPVPWPMSESAFPQTPASVRTTSHNSPVIALLQAYHFEQFITVHSDGQAATWAVATGSEIMTFSVCPDSAVASCAILDPKQRRLVVGADDGVIRVYNFCNGQNLHELTRSASRNPDAEKAEVASICFVYRQMRLCLAATYSDTSSISFWPEYPSTYMMSAVSNLDVRGNFGLSSPEQIGFLHSAIPSCSSNGMVMLMASGRLATISIDSGHAIAEFHVPKAPALAGHRATSSSQDAQAIFALSNATEEQPLIRHFVLAHKQSCLIAAESENRLHCWDFARNALKSSFEVPSRRFSNSLSVTCIDISSDDGLLCVGDSHGIIHTYVHPFAVQTTPKVPNWSFSAHTDSITNLKFVGTLDIIISSGSDSMTNLWRPDGKYFMHNENDPESSISNPAASSTHSSLSSSSPSGLLLQSLSSLSSSSSSSSFSNALGSLACRHWKYEAVLIAQGRFTRIPKPTVKTAQLVLRKLRTESKRTETVVKTNVVQDEDSKPRPQLLLKSLKLLPPESPQEEREQSRMLLALATPRRGPPAIAASSFPHLQSLRGPHCKIVVHPIAPDPYFTPAKGFQKDATHTPRRDAVRAFLPKDSFKESILRQEQQASRDASPLLKRSLKLVRRECRICNSYTNCFALPLTRHCLG